MKKCSLCGIEKNISFFHKDAKRKDGFFPQCKECRKLVPKKPRTGKFVKCSCCKKDVYRKKGSIKKHNFCSNSCLGKFYTSQPGFQEKIKRNYGKDHFAYKGGYIGENGYKKICIKGKQVYEHRYLMEEKLGRKLERNETIHHIDGNKTNNTLENLLLLSRSEHTKMFHSGNKNKCHSTHKKIQNGHQQN